MKIIKQIQEFARKALGLEEYARLWLSGLTDGEISSGKVTNPYAQVALVNRCISNLADEISGLPVMITDNRENRIESGPLYDLLERPNATTDGYTFWQETVSHLMLGGEVYWITVESGPRLQPKQITVIGASQMEPVLDKSTGELLAWKYKYGQGRSETLATFDVVQIKLFNPRSRWRGLSPLEAAKHLVEQNFKADVFYTSAIDNGCELGGILTADDLSSEQEAQIKEVFEARHRGAGNAKRIALVTGGLKYQETAKSMIDMQLAELKGMSNKQLCVVLKTPPPVVGIMDEANYKMEAALKVYFNGSIQPLAKRIGNIFTVAYARRFGQFWVWMNVKEHPTSKAMMRETISDGLSLVDKGATFNDVNKLMDWGLPEYKWGDTWYKPMTLVPVDEPLDLGPTLAEGGAQTLDLGPSTLESKVQSPRSDSIESKAIELIKTDIWRRWKSSWSKLEKKFAKDLGRYFFRQRKDMLQRLEAIAARLDGQRALGSGLSALGPKPEVQGPKPTNAQGPKPKASSLPPELVVEVLFDVNAENRKLRAVIQPLLQESAALGGSQVLAEIGSDVVFGRDDPAVVRVMRERTPKLMAVNTVTRQRVAASLSEGIKNGETINELAQRVREHFAFGRNRAMTIARTETAGAVSGGRHAGLKRGGVGRKTWLSARNATVRPTHQAADATYSSNAIDVDEAFVVGGAKLMHPGDPAGPPEEIINCACVELPAISREGRSLTLAFYSKTVFLSYEEWINKQALGSGLSALGPKPKVQSPKPISESEDDHA
jgi:HK97 family phage portal protein